MVAPVTQNGNGDCIGVMSGNECDEIGDEKPLPPPRLYERLAHITGYTWDQSLEPFHSVRPGTMLYCIIIKH